MPLFLLALLIVLIYKFWESHSEIFVICLISAAIIFSISILLENRKAKKQQEMLDGFTPQEMENYEKQRKEEAEKIELKIFRDAYGEINSHLICPHCQTKGVVHAKQVVRHVTSIGKVGGVLKTDTKSTIVNSVTQHHCIQCNTTWDV